MNEFFLLAQAAGPMPWIDIAREIGVLAALAGFFTWQSWRREERLANRVTQLEVFIETKLMEIIEKSMEHISENADVMRNCSVTMAKFCERLSTRPCLYEDMLVSLREQGYKISKENKVEGSDD
jgi:hypothetical protein